MLLLTLGSACSLKTASKGSHLSLVVPNPRSFALHENGAVGTAPSAWNSTAFLCYGINVVGTGIQDTSVHPDPSSAAKLNSLIAGTTSCAYRGIVSAPFQFSSTSGGAVTIDMQVPPGSQRVIQLVGITNAAFCASNFTGDGTSGAYEIGHAVADLTGDTTVSIPITYTASETRRVDCGDASSSAATVFGVASATIGTSSQTNSTDFPLSYTGVGGPYDQYCILENDTTVGDCTWRTGSLPSSYAVSSTEGAKALTIWIQDSTTMNISSPVTTQTVTLDTTAPSLSSVTVTTASPTNLRTWALSFGTTVGSYSDYCLKTTGTMPTAGDACWISGTLPAAFNAGAIADGPYEVYAWLRDSAGNISTGVSTASNMTLDTTAPVFTFSTPTTGATVQAGTTATITWSPSESVSTASTTLEYSLDGGTTFTTIATAVAGGSYAWSVPTGAISATNAAKIRFTGTDSAGNTGSALSAGFTVVGMPATMAFAGGQASPDQFSCQLYALQVRDAQGRPTAEASARTFNLSVSTVTGWFFDATDLNCLTPLSSISMPAGSSSLNFFFMATNAPGAGTMTITSSPISPYAFTVNPVPHDYWGTNGANASYSARSYQSTVWTGTEMIVWGGLEGGTAVNTGMRYNPATDAWTIMSATGAPAARYGHGAVWTGSKMIVFGGYDGISTYYSDVYAYDPTSNTWTILTSMSSARRFPNYFFDSTTQKIYAAGGCKSPSSCLTSVEAYDVAGNTWTAKASMSSARENAAVGWTGARFAVYGGLTYTGSPVSGGEVYDPTSNTWTSMATSPLSGLRTGIASVVVGARVYFFGGESGSYFNDSALYDPVANAWTTVNTVNAPSARANAGLVYDPAKAVILVWGGNDVSNQLNTGGFFDLNAGVWRAATPTTGAPTARMLGSMQLDSARSQILFWGGDPITGTDPVWRFKL